jgi:hypothetical protein
MVNGEQDEISKMSASTRFTFDKTREDLNQNKFNLDESDLEIVIAHYDRVCDEARVLFSEEIPLCVISKEPLGSSGDRFTLAITVALGETDVDSKSDHAKSVNEELAAYKEILSNFVPMGKPQRTRLGRYPAYGYYATFDFEHENLKESVSVRALIISVKHYMTTYDIKLYDAPRLGPDMVFDYSEFLDEILLR